MMQPQSADDAIAVAASFLQAGSQTWRRRIGGVSLHCAYFSISQRAALTKLLLLATPYLGRWNYARRPGPASPDLYLPVVSTWTYVLLLCASAALQGQFKPDMLHASAWSAGVAWGVHAVVAYALLRAMGLPSAPWLELFAYTGYAYVPVCASLALGIAAGKWAYRVGWLYGSLCMSVFMVRTFKAAVLQEAEARRLNRPRVNYLLLALAVFQFPLAAWLGSR